MTQRDPLILMQEVAEGALGNEGEHARFITAMVGAWFRDRGTMPLERYAHLPTTRDKFMLALRDAHLQRASRLASSSAAPYERAKALLPALRDVARRLPAWRQHSGAPYSATELQHALFEAAQWGDMPATTNGIAKALERAPVD